MTKTTRSLCPSRRPVGVRRLKELAQKYAGNVLVKKESVCRGWVDEETGRTYSAFGSFAHYGTSVSFFKIHDFYYRGKQLMAATHALPVVYDSGARATRGDVIVHAVDDVFAVVKPNMTDI